MPKRTRCPYCDKLFSRDAIDGHIQHCRERERTSFTASRVSGKKDVVIDGTNLAYYLTPNGKPSVDNLLRAMNSLTHLKLRFTIVVSSALKHKIDRPERLSELIHDGHVIEAPRGMDDDLTIITMAQKLNADIISNDRFLNWTDKYPWVPDRLRKYRMTPTGLILE